MMGGDKDKNLDDNLPGSEDLSSLYEHGKKEEPSTAIDKYILQAARNAVSEKKVTGTSPFGGSWQMPVALAAVLILAVGVTVTMEKFTGPGQSQVDRFAPRSDTPKPVEQAADQKVGAKPGSHGETKAKRLMVRPEETPASPAARKVVPASPPAESTDQGEKAGLLKTVPAAEPPKTIEKESQQQSMDIDQQSDAAGKPLQQEAQPTAERWLDSIRELVAQDKLDEARKQLADFRRVYPDYTLPEEFKRLEQ
jgi:hypothetical protein